MSNAVGQVQGAVVGVSNAVQGVSNAVYTGTTGISNRLGNVTNLLSGLTNQGTGTTNLLAGITNLLGRGTNLWGVMTGQLAGVTNYLANLTNLVGTTNYWAGGVGTNKGTAEALADANDAGTKGAIEGIKGMVGGPGSVGEGGASPIAVQVGNYTFNMNPIGGEWAGVWSFAKAVLSWLLVAGYLIAVAKDGYTLVADMSQARSQTVPNIQGTFLGIGGNWGAALVPGVLVAALGAYAVCIAVWITTLTGASELFGIFNSNPLSGHGAAVSVGIEWLKAAIPFSMLFGLTASYLIWRVTMAKALWVAASVLRALVG